MKFAHSGSVLVAVSALLGCAGGGGGNSGGASGPVTSTLSFPLQTGLANSVKNGSSVNFTVSGDCNGTASIIDALPASATFEGNAVQSALTTITLNLTNCVPLVSSSATTNYYDASFLPLGSITNSSYGLFLTPPSIPTSVKVGYTGTIGSQTLYLDRGKTVQVGTSVTSYVVEPDTINSAIINLVTKSYDSNTVLTLTEQDRYRILADGTMTAVSSDIQYSNSSTVHLLLTAATSATSPILGGWGVPSLVSNDLIFSVSDMQLAGDGVGNMFLAARWGTISPSKVGVAVFQKPLGLGWGAQFEISPIKTISVPPYVSNFIKPQIRAESAGNAVATWIDMDNSSLSDRGFLSNLYVQNYDKVNGWSLPILMQSDPTEYVISDNLTVQADGTAWVVWTERTYKDPFFSVLDKFALFAAKYTPLVGWGAAEKVTADYAITPLSESYPDGRITTDNNGNPTILWTDGLTLYATRRTAGVWGSSDVVVAFLSTPGVANVINDFDIAVDGSGNAIAVWQRWDSTGLIKTVYSNRYVANTGWTGVTAMSNLFFQ